MGETGQVAVFTGPRRPFEIREFPVPQPGPGAVLVKVRVANVCGSDLHAWRGQYDVAAGKTPPFSCSLGHEMIGTVVRLGEGVERDSAGQPLAADDRIVYRYFYPCGRCRSCLRRRTPRCLKAMRYRYPPEQYPHFNAAYGQYYYLHPNHTVFKVPENVSDDLAAPANCALSQVIECLQRAGAGLDDHVVIQGAGGLGINAIAVAREMGVRQIIVIDGIEERLELARAFGADQLVDLREYPTPESRVKRVKELTESWGADIVLEVAGHPRVIPEGIAMLGQGGIYVEVGNINQRLTAEIDPSVLVHGGKTIVGVMWYEPPSLQKALDLLATKQDKYPFHKILSHKYPLTAISTAFQEQDAGHVQRAALLPWG
ncbi:MAG: zinc-binding dehydrogenase [Planctomycetes bacterium]|nr:zinc-binding dehydrogenase [Planctomycetota bacterium]